MELFENKELCTRCGGRCCIASGCVYSPKDFRNISLDFDGFKTIIRTGDVAISPIYEVPFIGFNYLALHVRSLNGRICDIPYSTPFGSAPCKLLTPTGCSLSPDKRPTGGRLLKPAPFQCINYYLNSGRQAEDWLPYQKTLWEVAKYFGGFDLNDKHASLLKFCIDGPFA